MSKKQKSVSVKEGKESRENASVFDFLYHDSRRIASFLSQLDELGHLQQITQTDNAEEREREDTRTTGNLGIPGTLGGKMESGSEGSSLSGESSQRVYDPLWANARRFLDLLTERDMIKRDLDGAQIGQFVLASGYLNIQDLAMFKEAWKAQSVQRMVKGGSALGKKVATMTAAQKAQVREHQSNTETFLDLIQIMPHSVHARLLARQNDNAKLVWCTLSQEYLVAPASDITLTYGATMEGEWSVLGILSANPEYLTPDLSQQFDAEDFGLMESIVGQLSKLLAPVVRVALGRPAAAHAVTPLLIFRVIR